jgi:hypothetical protein
MGKSELHARMRFSASYFSGQFITKPVHNWESTSSHVFGFIAVCGRDIQRLQYTRALKPSYRTYYKLQAFP